MGIVMLAQSQIPPPDMASVSHLCMPDRDRDIGKFSLNGKNPKLRDGFLSSNEAGHAGYERMTRMY